MAAIGAAAAIYIWNIIDALLTSPKVEVRPPRNVFDISPRIENEYSGISGKKVDFEIIHISQYLLKLIEDKKLKLKPLDKRVTYHDPCDLGRNSEVYDEPRKVIESIPGVEFIELEANKKLANCCGGGGNLESLDEGLSGRIAQSRAREIIAADVDVLVSACQQCERTLVTALKKLKKEAKRKIKVWDIAELILASINAE